MNIRKIKKVLRYYVGAITSRRKKSYDVFTLGGIQLKGMQGVHRKKADKDDAWFFELARNSTSIFDIGCNLGYMSLLAAIQPANKSLVLVDPNPEALAKAAQNMIINGFAFKCRFFSAFVADKDDEKIKFFTVGSGEAGSMFKGHAETAGTLNSFYHVSKKTIDTLVSEVNCVPDLIKIDIEGAEHLALQGAVETAALQKTKFMIEMHSPPELPMLENATNVLNWASVNSYAAYYMKDASKLTNPQTIAHRGKCHLLLIPINEEYPEYLKSIKQGSNLSVAIRPLS